MGAIIRAPRIRILGASGVAVSGPADTSENILATITVPAGAMGLNGFIRWWAEFSFTNSANNKSLRTRFGGIGGTPYLDANGFTTQLGITAFGTIGNRGLANSQVGSTLATSDTAAGTANKGKTTSSIDTSAATTLVITGQKASAGETITLESYLVELILP